MAVNRLLGLYMAMIIHLCPVDSSARYATLGFFLDNWYKMVETAVKLGIFGNLFAKLFWLTRMDSIDFTIVIIYKFSMCFDKSSFVCSFVTLFERLPTLKRIIHDFTPRTRSFPPLISRLPIGTPKDLGGMRSTSVRAFAYPKLVEALGLPPAAPPRRRHYPDARPARPGRSGCIGYRCCVHPVWHHERFFLQPDEWHDYDFNGRLPAQVRWPDNFQAQPDGSILQDTMQMPPTAYTFDGLHAGQPLDFDAEKYI